MNLNSKAGAYIWIILAGLVMYSSSLFFGLTDLDDRYFILEKAQYLSNPSNAVNVFTTDVFALNYHNEFYRPVFVLSLMADKAVAGNLEFAYHFTNLILHIIAGLLVFQFFSIFISEKGHSLLLALLFMIHPALSRAVVWIPGRNDVLMAVFLLASFIFLNNYLREKKISDVFFHIIFLVTALFTKETSVAMYVLMPLYAFLFFRNSVRLKQTLVLAAGWGASILLWWSMRVYAFTSPAPFDTATVLRNLIVDLPALLIYLGKAVFPLNLSMFPVFENTTLLFGISAAVLLSVLLFLSKQRDDRNVIFGFSWFFIFLLPSMVNAIGADIQNFAEQRLYLPILGIFLAVYETDFVKKSISSSAGKLLLVLFFGIFAVLNLNNSLSYRGMEPFWARAVSDSPGYYLSHRGMGKVYYHGLNDTLAEREFKMSEDLNPGDIITKYNLGVIYMNRMQYQKAEEYFREAVEMNGRYAAALDNLAFVLYKQGRPAEAEKYWKEAIAVNPAYSHARENLQNLLDEKARTGKLLR